MIFSTRLTFNMELPMRASYLFLIFCLCLLMKVSICFASDLPPLCPSEEYAGKRLPACPGDTPPASECDQGPTACCKQDAFDKASANAQENCEEKYAAFLAEHPDATVTASVSQVGCGAISWSDPATKQHCTMRCQVGKPSYSCIVTFTIP